MNLNHRTATCSSPSDKLLLAYIRRVNLDMMWAREKSTVRNTLAQVKKGKTISAELGLSPVPLQIGPWPVEDMLGTQI